MLAMIVPPLAFAVPFILKSSRYQLIAYIPDDSFYYLTVARNFWKYHCLTYDGFSKCYGFQPLWQLVLIALGVFSTDPNAFLTSSLLLSLCLFVTTAILMFDIIHQRFGITVALLTTVLWTFSLSLFQASVLYMMESALLAPLILLTLRLLWRPENGLRTMAWIGGLLGLIVLTRVNAVILAAIVIFVIGLQSLRNRTFFADRHVFVVSFVALLVCFLWFTYSHFSLGTLLPYSGIVKIDFAKSYYRENLHIQWLSSAHFLFALQNLGQVFINIWDRFFIPLQKVSLFPCLLLALPMLPSFYEHRLWRSREFKEMLNIVLILILYALINAYLFSLFITLGLNYTIWYFVAEAFAPIFFMALLFWIIEATPVSKRILMIQAGLLLLFLLRIFIQEKPPRHSDRMLLLCGAIFMFLIFLMIAARYFERPLAHVSLCGLAGALMASSMVYADVESGQVDFIFERPPAFVFQHQMLDSALFMKDHFPENTIIASTDTGILGYFSGMRVINMEGLMNSLEYHYQFALKGRYLEYLNQVGAEYLFGPAYRKQGESQYRYKYTALYSPAALNYQLLWIPFREAPFGFARNESYVAALSQLTQESSSRPDLSGLGETYGDGGQPLPPAPRYINSSGEVSRNSGPGYVCLNFECPDQFAGWRFGNFVSHNSQFHFVAQSEIIGKEGAHFVNTYDPGGDGMIGRMVSNPFRLTNSLLIVKIAGGRRPGQVAFRVWCEGAIVASLTGINSESLRDFAVDLSLYKNKTIQMEILDRAEGPWGHIMVDDIRFVPTIP